MENKCSVCGKDAVSKCAACGLVFYCSRQHQKLDWSKHKNNCSPLTVTEDDKMGRILVASRDIKQGEVVLKEKPLLTGPSQTTGPVCLGCYTGLTEATAVPCDSCGWPLCSRECAQSPDHRPECHWTNVRRTSKVKISQFMVPHPTYGCVTALRYCYLKTANPTAWNRLNSLEDHGEARAKTEKYEADKFGVVNFLRRFYNLEEFSEEEILKICGVIQINGHEVPLSEPRHVSVYWRASMFEHNCRANCSKSFSDKGELVIRAAENIGRGRHVSICYTDPMWPTPLRQMHLTETKFFTCECDRCNDPTELGSYVGAILCGKCKGYVLPCLDSKDWKCEKCQSTVSEECAGQVLTRLSKAANGLDKTDLESCLRFIKQDTVDLVPGCHYLVREAGLSAAQIYGQAGGIQALSDGGLEHKLHLCRQLLGVIDALLPAECRIRGVLCFELHAAIAESARRQAGQGLIDSNGVFNLLMESKVFLEKARDLLKYEPQVLAEGKIAKQADINLKDLEKLLRGIHISIGDTPM